jgi:hypothetical protein
MGIRQSGTNSVWYPNSFKTYNVSFLFLIKHLFKSVALLCIYIIIIVLLLIYMWDFNSFMYVFSYE